MKAAQKDKIADMIRDRIESSFGNFDYDTEFEYALDFLEDEGFDHFVRQCDVPKNGEMPKLPPAPRDTKDKVHIIVAQEAECNAYRWYGQRLAGQVWVTLDRSFAMKALLFGEIPETGKADGVEEENLLMEIA